MLMMGQPSHTVAIRASPLRPMAQMQRRAQKATLPALSALEREVLPYYEAVAVIWVMANRPWNAEWIGYQLLQDDFWQQRLAVLRDMGI